MRVLIFRGIVSSLAILLFLTMYISPILTVSSKSSTYPLAYWEYKKQGVIKKLPPYAIVDSADSHLRVKVENLRKDCKVIEVVLMEEDWSEKDDPVKFWTELFSSDDTVYTPWMDVPSQPSDPGAHSEWYANVLMLCGKNRWKIKIRTHLIFVPHNKANFLLIENYHLRRTIKIGRIQIGNANTYIGKKYQKIPIASVRFKDSWNHDPEGYVKLNLLSSLPLGWNLSIFPARFSIGPNMSQIVDIYLNAYTPTPGSILFQVTTSIEGMKDATDPLLLRSHELNLVDWTLYVPTRMWVTIPAFRIGESIPSKYSCKGLDASPPILWNISTLPPETKSLALIMFDPTAPKGTFIHWILYNISPTLGSLPENTPKGKKLVDNVGI